jgi:hypothetical protein
LISGSFILRFVVRQGDILQAVGEASSGLKEQGRQVVKLMQMCLPVITTGSGRNQTVVGQESGGNGAPPLPRRRDAVCDDVMLAHLSTWQKSMLWVMPE